MESGAEGSETRQAPGATGVDEAPVGGDEAAAVPAAAEAGAHTQALLAEREAALSALQAEIEALTDSHRRLAADFANYRRRVERDRAEWEDGARGDLLLRLLPVFDNLRRARAAVDGPGGDGPVGALAAGLDMVLRGLDEVLSAAGVRESVKVGEPFDPATCEAIGEEPGDGVAPGYVTSVLQPGYRLGERVLRAALVRVASAGPEPAPADPEGGS